MILICTLFGHNWKNGSIDKYCSRCEKVDHRHEYGEKDISETKLIGYNFAVQRTEKKICKMCGYEDVTRIGDFTKIPDELRIEIFKVYKENDFSGGSEIYAELMDYIAGRIADIKDKNLRRHIIQDEIDRVRHSEFVHPAFRMD